MPPEQPVADSGPDFDLASDSTLALGGGDVALAPNMIGDLQGGGCGGLSFGGLLRVLIEHPTFGCSRLNIAENNSPLPRDRVYFRYNHFDQETLTDVFTDTPRGAASAVDLDRYTFGFEKTFFDGRFSTELRVPVNRQFVNTIDLQDTQGRTNLPLESRNTVFGNLRFTTKLLLMRSEKLKISSGVGVNIPTERSVKINVRVRTEPAGDHLGASTALVQTELGGDRLGFARGQRDAKMVGDPGHGRDRVGEPRLVPLDEHVRAAGPELVVGDAQLQPTTGGQFGHGHPACGPSKTPRPAYPGSCTDTLPSRPPASPHRRCAARGP